MKTLKKIAAPLAIAAASLSLAGAAQTQPLGNSRYNAWHLTPQSNSQIRQEISSLNNAIDRGEVRNLQNRVNTVRVALRMKRRDWDSRRG